MGGVAGEVDVGPADQWAGMDQDDFQKQLDDIERKMEKHRIKIREQGQEAQEQVEKAKQRQRDTEGPPQ